MSELPVGVFDSGVGGLTVLRVLMATLPAEDFLYLGDTARLPYGTKSPQTVARYSVRAAESLVARGIKGLLHAGFLVEGPRTCYSFSLWSDEGAILEFGTFVTSHVHAARHAFRSTFRKDLQRPEIWSTQWQLSAASNNLNWEGVDLRPLIAALAASGGVGEAGEVRALEEVEPR